MQKQKHLTLFFSASQVYISEEVMRGFGGRLRGWMMARIYWEIAASASMFSLPFQLLLPSS